MPFRRTFNQFLLPDPKAHLTLILILILYPNLYHPYSYSKFQAGLNFTLIKLAVYSSYSGIVGKFPYQYPKLSNGHNFVRNGRIFAEFSAFHKTKTCMRRIVWVHSWGSWLNHSAKTTKSTGAQSPVRDISSPLQVG